MVIWDLFSVITFLSFHTKVAGFFAAVHVLHDLILQVKWTSHQFLLHFHDIVLKANINLVALGRLSACQKFRRAFS